MLKKNVIPFKVKSRLSKRKMQTNPRQQVVYLLAVLTGSGKVTTRKQNGDFDSYGCKQGSPT